MVNCFFALVSIFITYSLSFAQPDSLWSRTFWGGDYSECQAACITPGGDFVLAGSTMPSDVDGFDYFVVKAGPSGESLWAHTYGLGAGDDCYSVFPVSDGGLLLGGATSHGFDFWLVRTDPNGVSQWNRTYGTIELEECRSVLETEDGGFSLAGFSWALDGSEIDFLMIKVSSQGDSLWSRTYDIQRDFCWSHQQTSDGGYILAGYTVDLNETNRDIMVVKTDANGQSQWTRTYGGEDWDECFAVRQTTDGGYILAGATRSFGAGGYDFMLMKIDAAGDSLWSKTYGGNQPDACYSVEQTRDGGFILAGQTMSFGAGVIDYWLVKVDADGDSIWSRTFGGNGWEWCTSVMLTADNGYALAGSSASFGSGSDEFWLVKTGPDPTIDADERFFPQPSSVFLAAYPNPFNSELTLAIGGFTRNVRISLHNLLGQEVELIHDGPLAGTRIHYSAPASLSSGIYFVRAADAVSTKTQKIVFLK